MSTEKTSRFVLLRVELVLEIHDEEAVARAALERIARDAEDPDGPRIPESGQAQAASAVAEDTAEALASLVDPFDLVGDVPGVELQQASWSSERIDYDPGSPDWDLDGEDVDEDGVDVDEGIDEGGEGGDDPRAGGAG
ncbi:hypothetical protein [Streptomyces antibioticus]|uniref:hypothetical protein n=1 Tax=Streptomyces antibioticus TaxID=1890 RepID=UPI00340B0C6E